MAARVDERVDVPSLVKFNVGESFTSYKCLQEKIKQYEAERCVQFTHRDSRTLETAKKRVPGRVACATGVLHHSLCLCIRREKLSK